MTGKILTIGGAAEFPAAVMPFSVPSIVINVEDKLIQIIDHSTLDLDGGNQAARGLVHNYNTTGFLQKVKQITPSV